MSNYSVATSNVYDLLNEDAGAPQAQKPKAQEKPVAATTNTAPSTARTNQGGSQQNRKSNNQSQTESQGANTQRFPRNEQGGRGGRGGGRGRGGFSRGGHRGESSGDAGEFNPEAGPISTHEARGRGNRRGRGRGRGDGTRREFDHRNPRMGRVGFDQQRKGGHTVLGDPVESTTNEEVRENAGNADELVEGVTATEGDAVAEVTEEIEELNIEPVEEDTQITYDEFVAQQKAKAPAEDMNIQTREVSNEKFGKLRALESAKGQGDNQDKDDAQRDRKQRNKKNVLSLDEFVGDAPAPRYQQRDNDRSRGGDRQRGGRRGGAGTGGRGRGGRGRGGAGHVVSFDENAFPRLG